jgi:hypothetical protein
MDLIEVRITLYILLAGILCGVGYAQETQSQSTAPSSSATTAKNVSPATDRVILKVGNVEVTQSQFESGFFNIGKAGDPEAEKEGLSEQDRRSLGENYALVLMLSRKAVAEHLDSTPAVSRELAMDRLQTLSNAEYDSLMEQSKPTSDEISKYYSAHVADYDQVRVRRLFIWKQHPGSNGKGVNPQDARARAGKIRADLAAGIDPKKLSDDLNNSGDGLFDAQPISFVRGTLKPQMEKVAFALQDGEWADVEDTPESLILVQLVQHSHRQLGEVASLIEKKLQGQKMRTTMDNLKEKAGIWMDKDYFATAGASAPGAQPNASSPPPKVENQ